MLLLAFWCFGHPPIYPQARDRKICIIDIIGDKSAVQGLFDGLSCDESKVPKSANGGSVDAELQFVDSFGCGRFKLLN